jgi:hypothetical protein
LEKIRPDFSEKTAAEIPSGRVSANRFQADDFGKSSMISGRKISSPSHAGKKF